MFLGDLWKRVKGEEPDEIWFTVPRKRYEEMEKWAEEEGIAVEDVMSKSVAMYEIARRYRQEGLKLAGVNDKLEVKVMMTIPGVTTLEDDPSPSKSRKARQP